MCLTKVEFNEKRNVGINYVSDMGCFSREHSLYAMDFI
jgi:hypothetical protein